MAMRAPGTCRYSDGITEVYTPHRRWIPYPETAVELIGLALANGWGVDDGLPCRARFSGEIYVRILLGRAYGVNALNPDGPYSLGTQFHIVWSLMSRRWEMESVYVKTGRTTGSWRDVDDMAFVRKTIAGNPVLTYTDFHMDEMENRPC